MTSPPSHGQIPILYLLTDEISSVLVQGQLGFLIEHGFDVSVATRRARPDQPPEPGTWDEGVSVEHVPFVREPSPFADIVSLWATVRLLRRMRPTIVNASTPKAGLLGMLAAWMCRVPVRVYVVRGFRFETATGWRRRCFVALERLAIRCATRVIFNSRSLMAVGEAEGVIQPGRGKVLGAGSGNGIDVDRFGDDQLPTRAEARAQFGVAADAKVIGFVGRFTKDKGIEDLIRAFTTLSPPSRERHAHLVSTSYTSSEADPAAPGSAPWLLLVGRFEAGDAVAGNVRATIESNERIVVVPWLDQPGAAYAAMDVLAFPSYREGLPNVPLEAQLCGVPVIAYRSTGTVDAVADGVGGVLLPVGDTPALAHALSALLDDPDRRMHLGRAGRTWVVERFDRDTLWDSLLDVVQPRRRPEHAR